MSLAKRLLGAAGGGLVESIGQVADRFIQTADEKAAFTVQLEQVLQQREAQVEQTIRSELQAKERVLVAEMAQGDNYTKRARPTVVYAGLAMIAWNYCLGPLLGLTPAALPAEFWMAWGGVTGVYSLGRSMEKRGTRNQLTGAVTGNAPTGLLE